MKIKFFLFCFGIVVLWSCSSLGSRDDSTLKDLDFGQEEVLNICVLVDEPTISTSSAKLLMQSAIDEFYQYKIIIRTPVYQNWEHPNGGRQGIIEALAAKKLSEPCDRILAIVGRDLLDAIVGLLLEELGAVLSATSTRGYVAGNVNSINQLFAMPNIVVVHEVYHMMGCQHAISMKECYGQIKKLKKYAQKNRTAGTPFFPAYSIDGKIIIRREDVDVRESRALKIYRSRYTGEFEVDNVSR